MKVALMFILLGLVAGSLVVAQKPDEATRKLWDTAYIAPAAGKRSSQRRSRSKYRIATPNVPTDNVVPESVVGVTIWRLRPAGRADAGERIIVHDDEFVPERISANTKMNAGDRVRISVEAARNGYLYVIDRE